MPTLGIAALLVLGLAAPALAGHNTLVGNRVVNGGFELGLTGWLTPSGGAPNVHLIGVSAPGPCNGAAAVAVENRANGGFIFQPVSTADAPVLHVKQALNPTPLLAFSANVYGNLANPGSQVVRVLDGWPLSVVPLVEVSISSSSVSYSAYGSSRGSASIPGAGCHEFEIELDLNEATGDLEAVLSIDGVRTTSVVVDAGFPTENEGIIQVGDVGFDSRDGAAPDVLYDDIFFAGHQVFL